MTDVQDLIILVTELTDQMKYVREVANALRLERNEALSKVDALETEIASLRTELGSAEQTEEMSQNTIASLERTIHHWKFKYTEQTEILEAGHPYKDYEAMAARNIESMNKIHKLEHRIRELEKE